MGPLHIQGLSRYWNCLLFLTENRSPSSLLRSDQFQYEHSKRYLWSLFRLAKWLRVLIKKWYWKRHPLHSHNVRVSLRRRRTAPEYQMLCFCWWLKQKIRNFASKRIRLLTFHWHWCNYRHPRYQILHCLWPELLYYPFNCLYNWARWTLHDECA